MSAGVTLYEQGEHRNLLLEDFGSGLAVQSNQHMIVHGERAIILDPGGHKVYAKVRSEVNARRGNAKLTDIFLSHQDPDIVAALNGWLMTTSARAHVPKLWIRFVAHFGIDSLVEDRIDPIPDAGRRLDLGGCELLILPAHFLHSCANFHLFDPVSRIYYSGDIGAAFPVSSRKVEDFEAHAPKMLGFHQRIMGSGAAMRAWAKMVRQLDPVTIAPQHGAYFEGPEMVDRFLTWCEHLECGLDLMGDAYRIPD